MASVHSAQIKSWARDLGFDLVGIAPAKPIERQEEYHNFLSAGRHGEMTYLARNVDKRLDPRQLVPGAQSIICTALNYYTGDHAQTTDKDSARIARYAWGRDYHRVIKERLQILADKIRAAAGDKITLRRFVDTAPLAEREHAQRAGLGWIGKNGLIINKRLGSWLLLGQIVTDLKLEYDQPAVDHCGACRLCLDACPTNAFVTPHKLDPRKCISYLTIESRQKMPAHLAPKTSNWIFGCDVCQEVCPFNRRAPVSSDPDVQPRPWAALSLHQAGQFDEPAFAEFFADSAMNRTSPDHLARRARNAQNNQTTQPQENQP